MAKKAKKDKSFVIKCAYCFVDDYRLEDVNKEESVKYYTDSPLKVMK